MFSDTFIVFSQGFIHHVEETYKWKAHAWCIVVKLHLSQTQTSVGWDVCLDHTPLTDFFHREEMETVLTQLTDEMALKIWSLMLPLPQQRTQVPLLMSNTSSFSRELFIAEVLRLPGEIRWQRFGSVNSAADLSFDSNKVMWQPHITPVGFELDTYRQALEHLHLLYLDKSLAFAGKRLVIIWGLYSSQVQRLGQGVLHICEQGLMLQEAPQIPCVPLGFRWVPHIRPIQENMGALFAGADFYLLLDEAL